MWQLKGIALHLALRILMTMSQLWPMTEDYCTKNYVVKLKVTLRLSQTIDFKQSRLVLLHFGDHLDNIVWFWS